MKKDIISEFVRLSMGQQSELSKCPDGQEWESLYEFAQKQAIVGFLLHGIEKLPKGQYPPRLMFMNWYGEGEQISGMNAELNKMAVRIIEEFTNDGFDCCVLKGQGNALMYPDPMRRSPGDIDIWMKPKGLSKVGKMEEVREEIIRYVGKKYKIEDTRYYHIEFHVGDIPVEAHFMPGVMNNPLYNKRLQRFYTDLQNEQCRHWVDLPGGEGRIPVPTYDFNVIFQLSHMMHHFFDEGIGLRQMMDYFYLLRREETKSAKSGLPEKLNYLGLRKFAGAVMYVMQEVLGLEQDYLIVPADERRGETLLAEIFKGGNFGQFSGLSQHGTGSKYLIKNWRSLQLVREYPAEALSEPLFRTYHFFWRKKNV